MAAKVRGRIVPGPTVAPFRDARVRIRLLDTSLADAPAAVLAEEVIDGVSYELDQDELATFELVAPTIDDRAQYTVSAEVEHAEPERGLILSVESFPVLTHGHGGEVKVSVEEPG